MDAILLPEILYGAGISEVIQTDHCSIYKLKNSSGEGVITNYKVFPGIEVCYNDMHMEYCREGKLVRNDIMEINHCREGRFECRLINGDYVYLEPGDLTANVLSNRPINSYFPISHFHGISILISMEIASRMVSSILKDVSVDLKRIRHALCPQDRLFVMRSAESIQHIFAELYTIPNEVKKGYLKLKVMELLLFLSVIDPSQYQEVRTYYNKSQVEMIKTMHVFMIEHLDQHFTLQELSEKFHIPLTAMKRCFKGIYGKSIYAYMRTFRMQEAAKMINNNNESITTIAQKVGYSNAGKFSSAFKDVMHILPSEYKKVRLNGVLETKWRSKSFLHKVYF